MRLPGLQLSPPQQVGARGPGQGRGWGRSHGGGSAGGGRARAGLSGSRRELGRGRAGATGRRAPAPRPQTKGRRAPSASVSGSLLARFLLSLSAPPGVPPAPESWELQGPGLPGSLCTPASPDPRFPLSAPRRPSRHPTQRLWNAGHRLRWDPPRPPSVTSSSVHRARVLSPAPQFG